MKGHKRPGGFLVCPTPESSTPAEIAASELFPASPPVTPTRPRRSLIDKVSHSPSPAPTMDMPSHPPPLTPPRTLPRTRIEPSFEIPERGPWYRRNPNWEGSTPPPQQAPRASSLVPTVLVDDDGNTVQGSVDGNNCEEEKDDEESVDPNSCAYCLIARSEDVSKLLKDAAKQGMYTRVAKGPMNLHKDAEKAGEDTRVLVASHNPEFAKFLAAGMKLVSPPMKPAETILATKGDLLSIGVVGGIIGGLFVLMMFLLASC